MKLSRLVVNSIFLTVLVLGIAAWAVGSYRTALQTPAVTGDPVVIEIDKGDSLGEVSQKLLDAQLAIEPFWFKVLAIQKNAVNRLKAGEYELASGLTMTEILFLFVFGKTKQYSITVPEGWQYQQFAEAIANNPKLEHTLDPHNTDALMLAVGGEAKHPEGWFFPDTYRYQKHTRDVSVLKRAYEKMRVTLAQEWQNKAADLPFATAYEALILASIVEKETAIPSERPMIAGVFVRRLKMGMPLQTDPTVIYGMGERFQGNISRDDLLTPTPYNTYVIKGLPPTPIALPGLDAIRAVLHPQHSENLYFVAKGDGSHVFSTTLKEHNQAVADYQVKRHGPR